MKKFAFIFLTCIIWFMLPTISKAYTEEQLNLFKQEYNEIYGINAHETFYTKVLEIWENNQSIPTNNKLYTYKEGSSYLGFDLCNSNTRITGTNYTNFSMVSGDTTSVRYIGNINTNNASDFGFSTTSWTGTVNNCNPRSWGTFEEWNASHVDYSWTNVSYDSTIPTPSIDVDLSKNINEKYFNTPNTPMYGQLGPEIPYYLGFKASSAYDGYYLYLDMTIWTPTSGELKLENGIYSFSPKSMLKTDDIAYLNWGDLYPAPTTRNFFYQTNAPLTGSTILITQQENLDNWYDLRRNIENGDNDYPEMSYTTTLTGTAKENGISRVNQMLRNASLAGNRVRFRACLYYINENNEIKCGNFATWTSAQPSSPTSEQPSNNALVVDQPANGISQTVSYDNVVSQNESTNNIPPVNVTTGGANVNVTVNTGNQNVPNNQNYPTVVSYNHDNIFTTFVGTYNSATQYLGGFAQFCNSCLLWIPSEIWSIIGMGFAMALVIMIVKIL